MTVPTVGILILKDSKVLLVRHEKGSAYTGHIYGLPSGRLQNPDEKEITAAIRELKEETGLDASEKNLTEFPGNYYEAKLSGRKNPEEREITYAWRVFLCKNFSGQLTPSEETTPEWVEMGKLSEKELIINVKDAVEAGLRFLEHKELKKL